MRKSFAADKIECFFIEIQGCQSISIFVCSNFYPRNTLKILDDNAYYLNNRMDGDLQSGK